MVILSVVGSKLRSTYDVEKGWIALITGRINKRSACGQARPRSWPILANSRLPLCRYVGMDRLSALRTLCGLEKVVDLQGDVMQRGYVALTSTSATTAVGMKWISH